MNKDKILFIIRGLPGSGKTTAANLLADRLIDENSNWVNASADDYFMINGKYKFDVKKLGESHKYCQNIVRNAMKKGDFKVFVSNTNTTKKELKDYYKLADEYGYSVISLIVENRHNGNSIHNVPEKTIEKMKKRFDIKL